MGIEFISWVSILVAFSLYGVMSGVELGVALLRAEPRLSPREPARRIFTPRLETTNILLALSCTGLAILSPSAFSAIVHASWPILLLGLLTLLVRAGVLVYLFLHKGSGKALDYLFVAASAVVPLSLGSAGIYMATGMPAWRSGVGATLFVSMVTGLLAVAIGLIYYVGGRRAPQGVVILSRALNITLAGLLAIVLLGALNSGSSHLFNLSYAYLAIMAAAVVLAQSICMASGKEWRMWWFLAGLALLAPFLIGLANYPYLFYPDIQLAI